MVSYAEKGKGKRKQLSEDEESDFDDIYGFSPAGPSLRKSNSSLRKSDASTGKKAKIDWNSLDRVIHSKEYPALAAEELSQEFRYVKKNYISRTLERNNGLYYPTYFHIRNALEDPNFTSTKKSPTPMVVNLADPVCEEFENERRAVVERIASEVDGEIELDFDGDVMMSPAGVFPSDSGPKRREPSPSPLPTKSKCHDQPGSSNVASRQDASVAGPSKTVDTSQWEDFLDPADIPLPEPAGFEIECGCCFGEYDFGEMVQCPEAHLFCKDCARRNAEESIGNDKPVVRCMDQSNCTLEFSQSELMRFLDAKALERLDRIRAAKAVAEAGFESLDECPFCDWKCIIDNEEEKLFVCQNETCGVVSCRSCKKHDHLPKSCKEMDADRKLDARHEVEEAMTAALMRKCPKCSKAFVKNDGCNKMRCPNCQTLSCYVCRAVVTGYEHFNQQPTAYNLPKDNTKCPLWEDVNARHHSEVAAAAKAALEKAQQARPDIEAEALQVDLPPPPPPAPAHPGYAAPPMPFAAYPYGNAQGLPLGFAQYGGGAAAFQAQMVGFRGQPQEYAAQANPIMERQLALIQEQRQAQVEMLRQRQEEQARILARQKEAAKNVRQARETETRLRREREAQAERERDRARTERRERMEAVRQQRERIRELARSVSAANDAQALRDIQPPARASRQAQPAAPKPTRKTTSARRSTNNSRSRVR